MAKKTPVPQSAEVFLPQQKEETHPQGDWLTDVQNEQGMVIKLMQKY